MPNNTIPIYLTLEEAELFKKFREYQDLWEKVFETKNGNVVLHFNNKGEIKKREFHYFESEKKIVS